MAKALAMIGLLAAAALLMFLAKHWDAGPGRLEPVPATRIVVSNHWPNPFPRAIVHVTLGMVVADPGHVTISATIPWDPVRRCVPRLDGTSDAHVWNLGDVNLDLQIPIEARCGEARP